MIKDLLDLKDRLENHLDELEQFKPFEELDDYYRGQWDMCNNLLDELEEIEDDQ